MPNPKRTRTSTPDDTAGQTQRMNKLLAAAGYGSRRECESLITSGRVEVDGQTVTELGTKVDPEVSVVKVDGTVLKRFRPVYFVLNKPPGVLCTNKDPSGRMLAIDLIPTRERVFSVGRLDRASEGLILLTNDGELAQRLAHPRYGVQKTYFATVQGEITHEDMANLRKGVYLSDGFARVDGVKLRRQRKGCAELEIVLSEGKNREIRRVLARLGHKVLSLRRLAIGSLRLGTLPVGASRELAREEISSLYALASAGRKAKRKRKPANSPTAPAMDDEPTAIVDPDVLAELDFQPQTSGRVISYDDDASPGKPKPRNRKRPAVSKSPARSAAFQDGSQPQTTRRTGAAKSVGRPGASFSVKSSGKSKSGGKTGRHSSARNPAPGNRSTSSSAGRPGNKLAGRRRPNKRR